MNEEKLRRHAAMWTTDVARYAIVEFDPSRVEQCLIFDLEAWAPMTMDDDPEVVAMVIENMRRAGARRLTPDEVKPR